MGDSVTDWISIVIQFGLALTAVWYASETRQLRLRASEEIRILKRKESNDIRPYLLPFFADTHADKKIKKIRDWKVTVRNPSNNMARKVSTIIYDSSVHDFLSSVSIAEYIANNQNHPFIFEKKYMSQKQIREEVIKHYPDFDDEVLDSSLEAGEISYILLTFKDLEDNIYLITRNFEIAENEVSYSSSRFVRGNAGL